MLDDAYEVLGGGHQVLWWCLATVLLLLASNMVPVAALRWLGKSWASARWYDTLPEFKMIPGVGYWQLTASAFRKKCPRSYLLQLIHAACKMQESARITMFWLTVKPIIIFFKAETVEVLLNNSVTITKSSEYEFIKAWLGEGLATSAGDKWRFQRKMLTPAFHFQVLDNFMTVIDKQASVLAKKLDSYVGEPWVDLNPLITTCTLDIVCQTMMGVKINAQSGCCKEYVQSIHEINEIFVHRILRPWLWPDTVFYWFPSGRKFRRHLDRILLFTRQVIKAKKEALRKEELDEFSSQGRKTLLELLVASHLRDSSLTEEDIREQVDTFMFAGHDTTSMAIFWTLYALGRHPEIQEKVFQEIQSALGDDGERPTTLNDLKEMKYFDCVIKESLRLYPPAVMIARQLNRELKIGKHTLKPGCTCFIPIPILHMDAEQFPRPEAFDPDRFLPENCIKRHPFAYIPFSAGPRNCIGQRFAKMEVKTVVIHIIRRFKVTSLDPQDKIQKMVGIVLKSAEPIRFKLEHRLPASPQHVC